MKELISKQQFLVRQPSYPKETATTEYFYALANHLAGSKGARRLTIEGWPQNVVDRAALIVTGYFQDILTDSGLWRAFTSACHDLYGSWLPYFDTEEINHNDGEYEGYVPFELNPQDVRFLVWYALCMNYEDRRVWDPRDPEIEALAAEWHSMLDIIYDTAPQPDGYFLWQGLELHNSEEHRQLAQFFHWLFLHSYLMMPAFALSLREIIERPGMQDTSNVTALQNALEEAMSQLPTGPLALYMREWLELILENKSITDIQNSENGKESRDPRTDNHADDEKEGNDSGTLNPTYLKFVKATGGSPIKFISGYESLNDFFINALGWSAGEKHLSQFKDCRDFVLLVNPHKGLLLAHDICRCIYMPDENPYYDKEYAATHAIELLTRRGACPADLLHFLWDADAIPDAAFPLHHAVSTMSEEQKEIRLKEARAFVARNRDFIARCYLQQYYRGD